MGPEPRPEVRAEASSRIVIGNTQRDIFYPQIWYRFTLNLQDIEWARHTSLTSQKPLHLRSNAIYQQKPSETVVDCLTRWRLRSLTAATNPNRALSGCFLARSTCTLGST